MARGKANVVGAVRASNAGVAVRLQDVANDDPVIHLTSTWRARLSKIDELDFRQLEDVFYAGGLRGATFQSICKYFGVLRSGSPTVKTTGFIDELKTAHESGQAELQMLLRSKTVEEALSSKNPTMLIWAGKQFAGFSDDGQIDIIANDDGSTSVGGLFTSIKANRSEDGTTVGPAQESMFVNAEVKVHESQ